MKQVLESCLNQGLRQHLFTGGVVGFQRDQQDAMIVAQGQTNIEQGEPISQDTLFDLASLTKVVATLPAILKSVEAGKLSFIDKVIDYVPEFGDDKKEISILHLLTHTSGLPAWRPFFVKKHGREEYLKSIAAEPMFGKLGDQVVYSDLGFMLLGFILERIWEDALPNVVKKLVFDPLGMIDTTYNPLEGGEFAHRSIAATEVENVFEHQMVIDYYKGLKTNPISENGLKFTAEDVQNYNWRKGTIIGTVHDSNAFYGLDGVSGHAGLFSTIIDLEKYMTCWMVEDKGFFDPVLKSFATRAHTGHLVPMRAIGWEASSTQGSLGQVANGCTGGDLVSEQSFGHTGFTGNSIWYDPVRKASLITLTNRVHPTVSDISSWRRSTSNKIFSSMTN